MNIVQITPGAGGMYCGGCFRDNALVAALRQLGHEVLMIPLYLPLTLDEADQSQDTPTFFNGINVYLEQKSSLFRRAPNWLHKLVGSKFILKRVARRAVKTRPEDVGELTLSMLMGEAGNQARELDQLIAFLKDHAKPDVVVLSNALMMGMVRQIREELDVPVVVTLQGEDYFVNSLPGDFGKLCWDLMIERAQEVDMFVTPSRYYGDEMMRYLKVDPDRMRIVHNGINLDGYDQAPAAPQPPALGYFARMCDEKGLGLLIDTFIELKQRPDMPAFKLLVGGGCGPGDEPYVEEMKSKLQQAGCLQDVEWHPNLSREEKIRFFQQLTVFCTPATYGESFGLYLIEAMAAGVPAVQPRVAAFPEILAVVGSGALTEPTPTALADEIQVYLRDIQLAHETGARIREKTHGRFSVELMAKHSASGYKDAIERFRDAPSSAQSTYTQPAVA